MLQMLMMLAGRDPAVLHALGVTQSSLQQQLAAHRAAAKWATMSAADKAAADAKEWRAWLVRYRQRLQQEADAGAAIGGAAVVAGVAVLRVHGNYLHCWMLAMHSAEHYRKVRTVGAAQRQQGVRTIITAWLTSAHTACAAAASLRRQV
jgi:hypothetical protein